MALNPNIILSGMPQPFDTNALLQQQISGMENINALERQRRADELAMQDRAAAAEKEAAQAQEAATLKALLPAYTYGIQTGDMAGALNLVPPEMQESLRPYADALVGKSPQEVQAALIGSLSSSPVGQEALAAIQRGQTAQIQLGQLDVSRGRLAFDTEQAAAAAAAAGQPKPMTEYEAERIRLDREKAEREAAAMGPGGVKLGPGERMTPEGTVELIPGTKAYNTASKAHASDKKDASIVADKIEAAKDKLNYILDPKNKDGFEYNFGGYYAAYVGQNMPVEAAQNMYAKLESLKADLKGAGLEQLRAGGSIGQITEAEWPIIEKQIDSITPYMGEKAARETLQAIQRRLDNIAERATEAYDMQWGDTQFYSPVEVKKINAGGGGGGDDDVVDENNPLLSGGK